MSQHPAPEMTNYPFGISQYTTWTLGFADDLRLYRQLEIEHVELCEAKLGASDADRSLNLVGELGLNVSSVQPRYHSPFPNSLRKFPAAPGERMRRLRETIRVFGRYFPGTTLVVNTGLAPDGNIAEAHEVAVREFKRAAVYAADHGVRLGLEPLHPIYMNTDTFVCSLRRAREMIDDVDHPAFGLFLDLWHFWEEPDAIASIRANARKIFGVHISDWRRPRSRGDRLLPGSGEIAIVPLLREIAATGYVGAYTLEIFSDLKLRDSLWKNPVRTATEGSKAFRKIWRRACA
jgi:sugar phosphate isomerase/epimerase